MKRLIGLCLALACGAADAKMFSFNNQNVAAYVRGGAGMSRLHQDAFANSSGNFEFSDDEVAYNFSGELGFQYTIGSLAFRLGVEAIRPKELDISAQTSAGVDMFTVSSSVFAYAPMITMEYVLTTWGGTRFYGFAGGGYSTVTFNNKYVVTPVAQGTLSVGPTYTEKGLATAMPIIAGTGFETLFTDNVTFSLDVGYRHMVVTKFKHQAAGAIIGGTVAKGDPINNMDGDARTLDLGGAMINASFKFYMNF